MACQYDQLCAGFRLEMTARYMGFKIFGTNITYKRLRIFARKQKERVKRDQLSQNSVESPTFIDIQNLIFL